RFENEQSTPKLLERILAYTKINIDDDIKKDALLYLEMRHLIIHNRSKADENFIIISQNKINIPKDKKLPLNYEISSKAIEQVSTLCHTIDKELIEKKMVRERNAILPTLRS
ncbi:MAG: hypothetical protein J1E33_06755, partial [Alistipes sp.]|nr:hypothetical protein [Alistipes sp.]